MESIRLIPNEMVKLVPLFDGEKRHLNLFIRKCEYIIDRFRGNEAQNQYVMQTLTSRLIGNAASLISERGDIETWDELRALLTQHFGDPRSEECINIELETLKIRAGESFLDFCNRIQSVRSVLMSKVNQIADPNMRASKKTIYEHTSLNVFLYNLPESMVRIVRLKGPTTLEAALGIVLEEVNFHDQYQARNKMSQHNPSNSTQKPVTPTFKFGLPPSIPQNLTFKPPVQQPFLIPNYVPVQQPRFNFGIPPNRQANNPTPQNQPQNNFGYRPQQLPQFGYRPQNFGYRPVGLQPQPPMRPQQFGMQRNFNVPNTPNNQRPFVSEDVSMRTAPPARPQQGFRLNELDLQENEPYAYVDACYNDYYPCDYEYYPIYDEMVNMQSAPVSEIETTKRDDVPAEPTGNFQIQASERDIS
ncbi:uncharacterized protein LOC126375394 [Pectinophora gossypiella]|nr:uncharacterized protein LOC126369772 [Pectinophora gossypiella]XP_049878261.1 uncharacterized protein LOC126375394 [Pectinophora gossypiella]